MSIALQREAGRGQRLWMLANHDDAERDYAYGPAQGLPAAMVDSLSQALYDEAKREQSEIRK